MGFFEKIKIGLMETRNAIGSIFTGLSEVDDDFYDELEERLILADLGVDTTVKAVDRLRRIVMEEDLKTTDQARKALQANRARMLRRTPLHRTIRPQRSKSALYLLAARRRTAKNWAAWRRVSTPQKRTYQARLRRRSMRFGMQAG